jgi:hypothetical protein
MYEPNGLDRNRLQILLENYKSITEMSLDLAEQVHPAEKALAFDKMLDKKE